MSPHERVTANWPQASYQVTKDALVGVDVAQPHRMVACQGDHSQRQGRWEAV